MKILYRTKGSIILRRYSKREEALAAKIGVSPAEIRISESLPIAEFLRVRK